MLYMTYLVGPVSAVFQAVSVVRQGSGAFLRVNEVFGLPLEGSDAPADPPLPSLTGRSPADSPSSTPILEFRDVWFGYRTPTPVLRGVSFDVPSRGHIALVGPSGAGKSTVLALVERFYDPDRGRILFEGTDLSNIDRGTYRARIGLVEQHCPLLYGTLRDNLTYARPDAGDEDLQRVIELANLGELLTRLPLGLDTEVGERGMVLSGGERQRVAIARSLLAQPSVLLLDEPSSQLDPFNERALGAAIEQVRTECAMLVIAHRFSTVRAADRIVVLDQGRIADAGSHEELLQSSDYYRRLAEGRPYRPAATTTGPRRSPLVPPIPGHG
jgi:ABC-type multidrug transport system fused ATPase/permease subunit